MAVCKMKYHLFACLFLIELLACKKGIVGGGDFFSVVQIHYVDVTGRDLFRNGQNRYYLDSVIVYHMIHGIKRKIFLNNFPEYQGFGENVLYPSSGISITPPDSAISNQYTVSIIHLKPNVDDTLKIHLTGTKQAGSLYDSIWYNNVLRKDTMTITK